MTNKGESLTDDKISMMMKAFCVDLDVSLTIERKKEKRL